MAATVLTGAGETGVDTVASAGLVAGIFATGSCTAAFFPAAFFVEAEAGKLPPRAAGKDDGETVGAPPSNAGSTSNGAIRVGTALLCA